MTIETNGPQSRNRPISIKQVGVALGVFVGVGAAAALVRWPYNLLAEAIIDGAALLASITLFWWLIGLFYYHVKPLNQKITLIMSGIFLGVYFALSFAYFLGYIGYNYPASQRRIYSQEQEIKTLKETLNTTGERLSSVEKQLTDALAAMTNPNAVSNPSYHLDTSLKLQFNDDGVAEQIESHNIKWDLTPVPEATKAAATVARPSQPGQPQQPHPQYALPSLSDLSTSPTCQECKECNECPAPGPTYETHNALLLVLTFPYPIRATDVKFNSFGVPLVDTKILRLTERDGIIMVDRMLKSRVLSVEVLQTSNSDGKQ